MYIPALQSLRFLFILLIVASHLTIIRLPQFDAGGDCGVAFFFMLSGLVTWFSRHKQVEEGTFRTKEFVRQRISKLLWLHLSTWAFANLLAHSGEYFLHSLPALFLVQSWVPKSAIYIGGNPVSWFLSDLMLAWLLFSLLCRIIKHRWTIPAIVIAYFIGLGLIPSEYEEKSLYFLYFWPPARLVDFLLGMALGKVLTDTNETGQTATRFHNFLGIIGIAGIVAGLVFYADIHPLLRNACFFWPFFLMVLYAVCRNATCLRFLQSKPLVALGQWTLIIFMTHLLALKVIRIGLDLLF